MVPCQVIFNVCQFYMVHDYRSCASHALGPCLSVWHMVVNQSISNRLINKNFQADKSRNQNYIRVREGYSFYNASIIKPQGNNIIPQVGQYISLNKNLDMKL